MEKAKVEALCNGNHKAFEDIFIMYFRRVKVFIGGIIKSNVDAEELAQDVFIKLWQNRKQIDVNKSLNAYLYAIARNATFNYLKHQKVEQSYLSDYKQNEDVDTPEEVYFAQEIKLLIEMTVTQMPAQRRRIYILSRDKGISNEDIANQLNISKKTVENQLSLALKEIRKVVSVFFLLFF